MRIVFSLGGISATPNHAWLTKKRNTHHISWVRTADLEPGDELMRPLVPWETDDSYDGGYLAGILDGEGSILQRRGYGLRVDIAQNPGAVLEQAKTLLEVRGFPFYFGDRQDKAKNISVCRKAHALRLLGTLRPRRLLGKFDPSALGRMTAYEWAEVRGVFVEPDRPMVTLSTDTKTYLADGYCAHNTDERSLRMWTEMTLSPMSPVPLRLITSYAGYENEQPNLLYDLYNLVVLNGDVVPELADIVDRSGQPVCFKSKDGSIFAMWDTEARMPWQTPDYYEQEAVALSPMEFLRVHRNQLVSNEDQFIPIEWWDESVKRGEELGLNGPLTLPNVLPQKDYPVCLGVDIGVTHDTSAVMGTYYDVKRQRIGLACSSIWTPTASKPIDLEQTVEAYIQDVSRKLRVISIAYDKTNFHRSMTTLKNRGLPMYEFSQQGQSMTKATKALFDALKNGTFEAYADPQLREHLKYARARATEAGYRISKDKYGRSKFPNDGAVALAMSVTESISRGGIDTKRKVVISNPFSDVASAPGRKWADEDMWLPEALRPKVRLDA